MEENNRKGKVCWVCGTIHMHTNPVLKDKDMCKSVVVLMKVFKLNLSQCQSFLRKRNLYSSFCRSCAHLVNEGFNTAKQQDELQEKMELIQSQLLQCMNPTLIGKLGWNTTGKKEADEWDDISTRSFVSNEANMDTENEGYINRNPSPGNSSSTAEINSDLEQGAQESGTLAQEAEMQDEDEDFDLQADLRLIEEQNNIQNGNSDDSDRIIEDGQYQDDDEDEAEVDGYHPTPYAPSFISDYDNPMFGREDVGNESGLSMQTITRDSVEYVISAFADVPNEDDNEHQVEEPSEPPPQPMEVSTYCDTSTTNHTALPTPTRLQLFICVVCNIFCLNAMSLGDHYKRAHSSWTCVECHTTCPSQQKLYKHRNKEHNFPRSVPIPEPFLSGVEGVDVKPRILQPPPMAPPPTPTFTPAPATSSGQIGFGSSCVSGRKLRANLLRFSCSHCPMRYRMSQDLEYHCQTQHDYPSPRMPPPKNRKKKRGGKRSRHVMCVLCDKLYPSRGALGKHYASRHPNAEWKCPSCHQVYPHRYGLYKHRTSVHKEDFPWHKRQRNNVK